MTLEKTPDMEGMTPAERAALYKQRSSAAGIGQPPHPGTGGEASGASAPTAQAGPAAPAQPAAPPPQETAASAPAAAAKAAEPAPKPAEPEKPRDPAFVLQILAAVPGSSWERRHGYAEIKVPREALLDAARMLSSAGFDYLSFVTEVDWQDRFELLYHVYSYDYEEQATGVVLRTDLPREGVPEVASVTPVWPGAEFMERESAEMMGIRFLGHPDLRRILLPDDFVGYPMRKDYETDYEYVTVKQLVRELDSSHYQGR